MEMKTIIKLFAAGLLAYSSQALAALEYPLPKPGNDVVGEVYTLQAHHKDSLWSIGKRTGVGVVELIEANPNVNPKKPGWRKKIVVPAEFVLPRAKREGIVINLAEMRLYYYPKDRPVVITMPVGIGMQGWKTPTMNTNISHKKKDPSWRAPKSIREASAANGVHVPAVMPPGPRNPLGKYALRLGGGSYLLHGTQQPQKVGERVSAGCIRLKPKDIEQLYQTVPVGTPVRIVDQPYKAGWRNGQLLFEAHLPLTEYRQKYGNNYPAAKEVVKQAAKGRSINWPMATQVMKEQRGIPTAVAGKSSYSQQASR